MQEFIFVFVFVIFSFLIFSIFCMKRKETELINKIIELEYELKTCKETDLYSKTIELEHELKMCKEDLRIEKARMRDLTFIMLTSKH